ncbi:hypothetical protein ACFLWG_00230 [Chloroflexota bacterium]
MPDGIAKLVLLTRQDVFRVLRLNAVDCNYCGWIDFSEFVTVITPQVIFFGKWGSILSREAEG